MPAGVSGSFGSITTVRAGAADVLLAAVAQGRMQFAERVPVASRRYTKKAGRRKVYVCRREDVQCSAVRNRASAEQG